jgi:2'-5' RNA ligase
MKSRFAILAFPALESGSAVEFVRRKFDPLALLVPAHVTLVFPVTLEMDGSALRDHVVRAVASASPISLTLHGVTIEDDGYLFLNLTAGADRFIELHESLYQGPLSLHRSLTQPYRPHVTIGRIARSDELAAAAAVARTELAHPIAATVNEITVVRLDEASRTQVEFVAPLRMKPNGTGLGPSTTEV